MTDASITLFCAYGYSDGIAELGQTVSAGSVSCDNDEFIYTPDTCEYSQFNDSMTSYLDDIF